MRILPRTARRRGFGFDPLEDRRLLNGGYYPNAGYGHIAMGDAQAMQMAAEGAGRGERMNRSEASGPIAIPSWPGDVGGWASGGGPGGLSSPDHPGGPMPPAWPSSPGGSLTDAYYAPTSADLQAGATPAGTLQGASLPPTSPSPTSSAAATNPSSGSPGGWMQPSQDNAVPAVSPAVQPAVDVPGFPQAAPAGVGGPGSLAQMPGEPNGFGSSLGASLAAFLAAVFAADHARSENFDGVAALGGSSLAASGLNAAASSAYVPAGPLALAAPGASAAAAGLSASTGVPGPPAQPATPTAADPGHATHLAAAPPSAIAALSRPDGRVSLDLSRQGGAPGRSMLATTQTHSVMLPVVEAVATPGGPEEAPVSPLGADLIAEAFPFAGDSLERSLDAFVRQLEEVEVVGLGVRGPAPILVSSLSVLGTAASALVVFEMLQRRGGRGKRIRVVDSLGRELALSFPELPRSWSQRR
ncbi:MAG: hypothetical protein ACYC61_05290 [Isosphaeraceae bacterium]